MATPVLMPKQGQSVETCIITEWNKKKGDTIKEGEVLFSYETDKASFEETAPASGTLLDIFYEDGDEVPVLSNVAVIGDPGESIDEFKEDSTSESTRDEKTETQPETEQTSTEEPKKQAQTDTNDRPKISPRARKKADELNLDYQHAEGSGPKGRILERDVEKLAASGYQTTYLGKEKMEEEALAAQKSGTGIGGRALAHELTTTPQYMEDDSKLVKTSNMRKIIAQNMHASLQNSAQLTHHTSADARNILAFRKYIKKGAEEGSITNITLNDIICYAVIRALKKQPGINAHFLGDEIRIFNKVHLGMAVDTERGLMVPALPNADDYNLEGLSARLKALADSCKTGNIDPELLKSTAASFTVSNLGAYGVEMFTPVINLPQSGILGINTIIQRPGDVGGGLIGFIPYLGLSLTYDHRALDGAPASLFLKTVKDEIEQFDYTIE
jgi:pyruvate dehydrogenase E2 component (dihydrolipoamide acetyltransferase)